MADRLPEGTDQVKSGAAGTRTDAASDAAPQAELNDLKARAQAKAGELRAVATDHVRDYAGQGKDKATGALDNVAKLIDENASNIDDRLGSQYGDYARRASTYVSEAADGLRGKDVEDLLEDVRAFVRRSPAIALAAATVTGFLAARVVKAGSGHATLAGDRSNAATDGAGRVPAKRSAARR